MLHRVDGLGLLGGLERGRGVDKLPPREATTLLNASCELPGLELLSAACAVAVVNSIDADLTTPNPNPRPQCSMQPTLGRRGQGWLGAMRPQATLLLARAALSVVADSHWRSQSRGKHEQEYATKLSLDDAALLAAPAPTAEHKKARHTWHVEAPQNAGQSRYTSPPFR